MSRTFRTLRAMSSATEYTTARRQELEENIASVMKEMGDSKARLVAISKIKPASDIKALYDAGYRHFGENYIQELAEKAPILPKDIKWHFVGALQSNKSKIAASIPNLFVLETLSSIKVADMLQKHLDHTLNVYLQVNTSGEDSKSGLSPLTHQSTEKDPIAELALHVKQCDKLNLLGLMTIGSWEASHESTPNPDFSALKETRKELVRIIGGKEEDLELSMGMSADFAQAIAEGSSSVRVGTRIFGERKR